MNLTIRAMVKFDLQKTAINLNHYGYYSVDGGEGLREDGDTNCEI